MCHGGVVDGDVLGERPDPQVAGAGVDFVADHEVGDLGADVGDDTGNVVSQGQWHRVLEELFELAVADEGVEWVDAGCHDLHVNIAWPEGGGRDLGGVQRSEEHTTELQSLMRISYA